MLIVGDNLTVQEVLSRSLASLGHKAASAGNGLIGETLFLICPHDLVVVYLQMPLMNVWEWSPIFKERSRKAHLRRNCPR
jgi:CheY-like chemotaxis protein